MIDQAKAKDEAVSLKVEEISLPLPEAESILRALRGGEVDGVVVAREDGERVCMLSGAEHPYRVMIETMNEGAVTLTEHGRIVYCNKRFAEMVSTPIDQLTGSSISHLVADAPIFEALLSKSGSANSKEEIGLKASDGSIISTMFSVSPLQFDDETAGVCIVVTDLTDQKRTLELRAAREFERTLREHAEAGQLKISKILESITDSFIALDREWRFTDVNERAARILGKPRAELIGNVVWEIFPQVVGSEAYDRLRAALTNQRAAHFEAPSLAAPGKWFEVHAHPSEEGLWIYLRNITERKVAEVERERLLKELSETNRQKDEFLAMLSHELRNPLAPISNAVEVLRRLFPDHPDLQSSTDVIGRQVNDLARLIDDLLDASRITSGKVRLQLQTIELASVVSRAIEATRPLTEARRHQLTVSLPSDPVWLTADPVRLPQVLNNLLNNAAKYTEEGGDIALTAELEGDELVIRVRDTGVGIPPEILPHVFDLFTQADRSLDRSQGGLGIGLTLARSIVGMHGGVVQAFSAGPGQGSEFLVRLPVVSEIERRKDDSRISDGTAAVKPRRILIVDDNADSAETMALLLKLSGHEIEMAHDGERALMTARQFQPEIILLDVGLPGMHGYEVAERLRSLPENKNLVIVALTGYGQERDRQRAMEAGFDYHFVKPIDFQRLESLINSLSLARKEEG
ncbi:MAG TPA: ATP-binding protein [Blastocatellia bacterium]|nr:ATP-binding protein [Blastocatellia bacterium]